ncbi:hypothetical protein, partial [Caballeronia mineralivorans]|uniref:cupin domain-containing protein n=1 Tax=Caballeronia mineralivorans TaxID=2010198 RepID=UPI002AFE95C0
FTLAAGESYFAPRGIPQRLRNISTAPAHSLLVSTPGGFDQFIARAGMAVSEDAPPTVAVPPTPEQIKQLVALADTFGIEIIAPPAFGPA